MGSPRRAHRRCHGRRHAPREESRPGGRGNSESCADRRSAGLPPSDGDACVSRGRAAVGPRRGRRGFDDAGGDRRLDGAPRRAERREQTVGVPAVRPHGSDQHRQPAWIRCGCCADQGHRSRAGDVGRRQRSLLLPRSETWSDAGGRGSRSQRRVRRRAPGRRHELFELRQSRTTGDHVAVCARGRRHRRGVSRIERADHRRERQLV